MLLFLCATLIVFVWTVEIAMLRVVICALSLIISEHCKILLLLHLNTGQKLPIGNGIGMRYEKANTALITINL